MNDWTATQIKELVGVEIAAERRLRDRLHKDDRERFEEYKKSVIETLRVATEENKRDRVELERRLSDLNHAHAEAQRILHTYVPITTYERDRGAFFELKERVDTELTTRSSSSKGVLLLFQLLSGLAIIVSISGAIINYTKH